MKELKAYTEEIRSGINNNSFIKITLSKPRKKDSTLINTYIRLIVIKNTPQLSFTYHFKTQDQTKNFTLDLAIHEIEKLLTESFCIATLFTTSKDIILKLTGQNKASLFSQKPSLQEPTTTNHDRQKNRLTSKDNYLAHLGITEQNGDVIPKMSDKLKQINKYLEIIETLIKSTPLPEKINIVDMGSGKGYLTFALYDYLKNKLNLNIKITGIELREELVNSCNSIAKQCGFEALNFICQPIEKFTEDKIDILIALHACDTATDDAIYKGISSNASIIVCAPCCHKQIRQQVKGIEQESPLLKYGIFKERQFEMVTDTIRALIMENYHYESKIFEFVSNEHTRKNIILVGTKTKDTSETKLISKKIDALKEMYHIEYHYLEQLVKAK